MYYIQLWGPLAPQNASFSTQDMRPHTSFEHIILIYILKIRQNLPPPYLLFSKVAIKNNSHKSKNTWCLPVAEYPAASEKDKEIARHVRYLSHQNVKSDSLILTRGLDFILLCGGSDDDEESNEDYSHTGTTTMETQKSLESKPLSNNSSVFDSAEENCDAGNSSLIVNEALIARVLETGSADIVDDVEEDEGVKENWVWEEDETFPEAKIGKRGRKIKRENMIFEDFRIEDQGFEEGRFNNDNPNLNIGKNEVENYGAETLHTDDPVKFHSSTGTELCVETHISSQLPRNEASRRRFSLKLNVVDEEDNNEHNWESRYSRWMDSSAKPSDELDSFGFVLYKKHRDW
ncbi:hypothetical protein C8Q75DRAFT_737824 [Abortiporus biennis]|nr:hypothetical protein C8Q75DRAFT_737824 [Abortiporus biennis]